MASTQKSKAKGRKIGRNAKRPSAVVYKATNRFALNQAKKAKRHRRKLARIAIRSIQYKLRHGLPADASRLTELRAVVAQNHT